MDLTKNAIGNLINKYRAVLSKCRLLNTFGTLAVAGALVLGAASGAVADSGINWEGHQGFSNHYYAGSHADPGNATGGNVYIDEGDSSYSIYGGHVWTKGDATNNSVIMTRGEAITVGGGYTDAGIANNNTVTVSGGALSSVLGGYTQGGDADNNTVTISGDSNISGSVYGSYAIGGHANNNTVSISGENTLINGSVYSGYASAGDANNNTLIISGGTIGNSTGYVIGGRAPNGSAEYNTVIYSGGKIEGTLWGGLTGDSTKSLNNTLLTIGKRTVGGGVDYFQNYRFHLPVAVAPNDIILEVGKNGAGVANIDDATVGMEFLGSPSKLQKDDSVTLINKTVGNINTVDISFSQSYGFLTNYDFETVIDGGDNALKIKLNAIEQKADNAYVTNGDGLNGYVKGAQDRGEINDILSTTPNKPGGVRFLSRAIDPAFGDASKAAAKAVESVMNAITVAAVPQMTMGANMAAVGAVTQRTSIAMPLGNMQSTNLANDAGNQSGNNAGDDISGMSAGNKYDKTGFGMWIMPLWQSNNTFGMKVGDNLESNTHASIGGVAIGADYTWDQMFRLGLTFNIGGGYAEGSGDFAKTTNNMNFWGVGAYAGLAYNNFGLTADVNYTSSYNKIKQELDSSFKMSDFKSDVQSSAISAGLRGEYKFETSALDITPHVGVRYMYLTTDEYDVKSGGKKVLKADSSHQSIWTFPVGVQFAKSFDMNNGWYVKPSLDLSVIPAAGDIEAKRDVRFTGVSGTLATEAQTMDWVSYGGQAGLEFGNNNMKLGVNYNLQLGAHSTNHGVFGTFRYEF